MPGKLAQNRGGPPPPHTRPPKSATVRTAQTQRHGNWEVAVGLALARLYKPLISPDTSLREVADRVLEEARLLTASTEGSVIAVDRVNERPIVQAVSQLRGGCVDHSASREMPLPQRPDGTYAGLHGVALNTGADFFTNDPEKHPAFAEEADPDACPRRFLAAPVRLGGRPVGQIVLAGAPRDYTESDLKAVKRLAGFYALALERRESEAHMKDALREKEILLREIHHRVKNNLQVISSLLSLQARNLSDPRALEMLKESQNRVRSMAMVHEQLHRSPDLSRIDFQKYVRNLTASLFSSYGVDSSRVSLRSKAAGVCLPVDVAVACGLIIQELVSNSIKHAFPDGRRGEIEIVMARCRASGQGRAEREWVLSVRDNGVGLPPQVDIDVEMSLGLRLVRILAQQLEARIECLREAGTEFRIAFGMGKPGDTSE